MEESEQIKSMNEDILRIENSIYTRLYFENLRQKNQMAVALAYLKSDQPNLAKLVLEGMEP